MTRKHVVADGVLGKVSRKVWELNRRILEGTIDPKRTLWILQKAIEGIPNPQISREWSGDTYLLECSWAFDHSHREFATFTLEEWDHSKDLDEVPDPSLEKILDPSFTKFDKKLILKKLKRIFEAQVPTHGSYRMTRLYRVLKRGFFGYQSGITTRSKGLCIDGHLEQEVVDFHLILHPICDFDDNGEPIPCVCDIGPNGEPIYLKDKVMKSTQ